MTDRMTQLWATAFDAELAEATIRSESAAIEAARQDVNAFAQYVFVGQDTGKPLIQASHHAELQDRWSRHDRTITWFPVEHGKTTQTIIRLCWLLGLHPERQYAYVSSKAHQAEKVVAAVGREIVTNERLRRVFPGLRPERSATSAAMECWGDRALRVDGIPAGTKDHSLAAFGVDGQILGARLHGVFIDNVLDRENTSSSLMRANVLSLIESEIVPRVLPGGFVAIIDTAWHRDDALHLLAKRPGWDSARYDAEGGEAGAPLWPERFPRERLDQILSTIGKTSYDRQYRNVPLSDSIGLFKPEYLAQAWGRVPWCETLADSGLNGNRSSSIVVTGVDLATRKGEEHDLTVLTTILKDGHRYRLLNITAARLEGAGILSAMLEIYRRFHAQAGQAHFLVEDNAAQVYIVQMARSAGVLEALGATPDVLNRIVVRGRTTGRNKRDLELGVPSLAADLEMNRWDIPVHFETEQLRDEMLNWSPDSHTGDRLMSLWIAREGMRTATPSVRVL